MASEIQLKGQNRVIDVSGQDAINRTDVANPGVNPGDPGKDTADNINDNSDEIVRLRFFRRK